MPRSLLLPFKSALPAFSPAVKLENACRKRSSSPDSPHRTQTYLFEVPPSTHSARMDSKMDVDTGKAPEPHRLSPATEPASIPTLDGWISNLMNCKQLAENDVTRLCDRVGSSSLRTFQAISDRSGLQAREILQDESNVQPVVSCTGSQCNTVMLTKSRNVR